jgi:predicted transposase YbfD/YdcC
VQLTKDVTDITDAARGKNFSNFMMAMALLKNYKPFQGPKGLKLYDLFKKFDKTWALTKGSEKKYGRTSPERTYEDAMKRRQTDPWNFLFIAGMWFQDLFNYDFRRTEMCIIPYATQQGEISFCAYNTGVGWRQIIENMHKNATVAQWYKEHGKHEIYAKGKAVNLNSFEHSLIIDADDAARVRHLEHDIPLTASEEDRIRRKKAIQEQAKVRAIYEELVLKKPQPTVVQIGSVSDIAKAVPANFKPVTIAPATGNGNGNGNAYAASALQVKEATAEAVAGD